MGEEAFRIVYEAVLNGKIRPLEEETLARCMEVAAKNKVLLQFLRAVNLRHGIRLREEARYQSFLENLRLISHALNGLDHAFIKLRKPVTYVPADVDVLVVRDQVSSAVSRLRNEGFQVKIIEPYCVTMTRGSIIVDLYVYPTLGGVIYLDARKLLALREPTKFGGIKIPVLEAHAEALTAIAHAIYKERIYTLLDYATVSKWYSRRTRKLAEELNCLDALQEALSIHELVAEKHLTLPHRIPWPKWLRLLKSKIIRDKLSRGASLNILKTLRDPRLGKLIQSKLTRETY